MLYILYLKVHVHEIFDFGFFSSKAYSSCRDSYFGIFFNIILHLPRYLNLKVIPRILIINGKKFIVKLEQNN
jgi:hypothetical protein